MPQYMQHFRGHRDGVPGVEFTEFMAERLKSDMEFHPLMSTVLSGRPGV